MSFTTERPKSTAELIAELKESRQGRTANRKALLETYMADKMSKERQSVVESIQADIDANGEKQEVLDSIRDRRKEERAVKESTLNRLTLLDSVKERTMTKVIFEMVYDALWIDDDVKAQTVQETYNAYKQTIAMVDTICECCKVQESDKTPFLKGVESAVTEVCKKAVDRTIQETKDCCDPDKEFEFTSEEEEELDKKLEELGRDEIVELVKKKVLAVVTDERKSGKEKAQMLKDLDGDDEEEDDDNKDDDSEDDDDENKDEDVEEAWFGVSEGRYGAEECCVKESVSAGAIALTTALLGVVIACEAIVIKDKMDLKKALKIYESKMNPKIKLSQLTPVLYKLDSAHRPTDRELSGFSKLINKNSNRAKVWKDAKGNPICVAICYSATEITPGYQVSLFGDNSGPTIDINVKHYYAYDVDPKYKKDGLYLAAMMAFEDGLATDNTRALVIDMKKAFPEEMKNTKVKMFGKTLESMEYDEDLEEGFEGYGYGEPVLEGDVINFLRKTTRKLIDAGTDLVLPKYSASRKFNSSELEAAFRVFEKYESPKYNRSDLRLSVMDKSKSNFPEMCKFMSGMDPSRVDKIYSLYCDKKIRKPNYDVANIVVYDYDKSTGKISFQTFYCEDAVSTKQEGYYLIAVLYSKAFRNPETVGQAKEFLNYVNKKYPEEMKDAMKKTVTESYNPTNEGRCGTEEGFGFHAGLKVGGNKQQKMMMPTIPMKKASSIFDSTMRELLSRPKYSNIKNFVKKSKECDGENSSTWSYDIRRTVTGGESTNIVDLRDEISFIMVDYRYSVEMDGDSYKGNFYLEPGVCESAIGINQFNPISEGRFGTEEGYVEPVEEGLRDVFKNIKTNMQHNKDVKDVSKYLNLFGPDCAGVFREASKLDAKGESDAAVKKYSEYIKIIQQKQKDADKYIKEKGYDSAVSQAVRTGLTQEINLTKSYIEICKKRAKQKATTESYKIALEAMIEQKQRRSLRNAVGGTLFESFMIANSNAIRDEAIMEGTDLDADASMNAALLETILQYTVLETLNTTKLYKFTSADINKIKNHNRKSLRG